MATKAKKGDKTVSEKSKKTASKASARKTKSTPSAEVDEAMTESEETEPKETASADKPPAKKSRAAAKAKKADDADDSKEPSETVETVETDETDETEDADAPKKLTGAAADAAELLAADNTGQRVSELTEALLDTRSSVATKAARVLHEIVTLQPDVLVTHVERFARGLTSKHKRVVQASADALPAIAKIAPARVAKHLDILRQAFEPSILDGKDGLVRTFANLCTASVAYQKRLEPVLTLALKTANGKSLQRWTEIVLPALKGEPHARARSVVEDRLDRIPRAIAQQIASTMNFKLRVRYR